MAHKTLVNGTAYEITGGVTLVAGVSYSIKNGKALIGGTAYDISFLLPPAVLDMWSNDYSDGGDSDNNYIRCITYADGYWVVGGQYGNDNESYARIAYATSPDGTWAIKDLWSDGGIACITYANGYWVVGGEYSSGITYYARIAYSTSLAGTWTTKNLWSDGSNRSGVLKCVTYANGYWVVGGRQGHVARIAYSTSPDGTWAIKDLWSRDEDSNEYTGITCITYANGYWVVGGRYDYSSSDSRARIAYSTSLDGTWTNKDLWSSKGRGYGQITCITYADGYWVVGGFHRLNTTGVSDYARIAYATSLDGTWAIKDLWSGDGGNGYSRINCIAYADGYWVVGGEHRDGGVSSARIACSTSLDGTWANNDLWSSELSGSNTYNPIDCIAYANGYWVVGGRYFSDSDTAYAKLAYAESVEELGNTK